MGSDAPVQNVECCSQLATNVGGGWLRLLASHGQTCCTLPHGAGCCSSAPLHMRACSEQGCITPPSLVITDFACPLPCKCRWSNHRLRRAKSAAAGIQEPHSLREAPRSEECAHPRARSCLPHTLRWQHSSKLRQTSRRQHRHHRQQAAGDRRQLQVRRRSRRMRLNRLPMALERMLMLLQPVYRLARSFHSRHGRPSGLIALSREFTVTTATAQCPTCAPQAHVLSCDRYDLGHRVIQAPISFVRPACRSAEALASRTGSARASAGHPGAPFSRSRMHSLPQVI